MCSTVDFLYPSEYFLLENIEFVSQTVTLAMVTASHKQVSSVNTQHDEVNSSLALYLIFLYKYRSPRYGFRQFMLTSLLLLLLYLSYLFMTHVYVISVQYVTYV